MKVESFELDQNKKIPIDDEAIDNAMEESEEWEAPQVSQSSAFFTTFASKIYKDFNSGIRELYNNEARACRTARDKFGARPRIEITIDVEERTFVLHGIDSLGISEEIFKQIIKVLGKSGNMSGNEVGMFGMGFVSYQMLTDFMTLDTWTREETNGNEHYTVFCREDLHTKKVVQKEPTLDTFGTRLEMILKPNVYLREVVETLKECSKFSTVETIINIDNVSAEDIENGLEDGRIKPEQYGSVKEWFELNNTIRKWTHEKYGMLEIQKFNTKSKKQMESIWRRNKQIDFYHEFEYEDDDIEFRGKLALYKIYEYDDDGKLLEIEKHSRIGTGNSMRSWDDDNKTGQMFLVGVPIKAELSYSSFNNAYDDDGVSSRDISNILDQTEWYINIKNERVYSPNANRDDLEREAETKIAKLVSKIICESIQENYGLSSTDDYINSINKPFYDHTHSYELGIESILGEENGGNLLHTLNARFPTVGNTYGRTLDSLLQDGGRVISLQSLRSDIMTMFIKHFQDKNIQFIRCKDHSKMRILEQWGVIIGDEYKAKHKLKMKRGKRDKTGAIVLNDKPVSLTNTGRWGSSDYFGGKNGSSRGRNYSTTIGEVNTQNELKPHRLIQFDNGKEEYKVVKEFMDWNSGCDCIAICRARTGLKIDTPEEFVEWFREEPLITTKGQQTIASLEAMDSDKIYYLSEGIPKLNAEEKIETLSKLLDDDVIFAWLTKDVVDRLSMYNKFRSGGIGYSKLRGKGISIQGINMLFKYGVDESKEYVHAGHGGDQVDKILNYYKTKDLFENVYDRLILDTMVKEVRNGNIPDEDETSITQIVIKRLNLE